MIKGVLDVARDVGAICNANDLTVLRPLCPDWGQLCIPSLRCLPSLGQLHGLLCQAAGVPTCIKDVVGVAHACKTTFDGCAAGDTNDLSQV